MLLIMKRRGKEGRIESREYSDRVHGARVGEEGSLDHAFHCRRVARVDHMALKRQRNLYEEEEYK